MAVEMAGGEDEGKPGDVYFVSVKRLRNGGMEFELNLTAAAAWATRDAIKKKIISNFGYEAEIKDKGFAVLIENMPLYFHPEEEDQMTVAKINGWDNHDFLRARWIKALKRRRPGQTSAHVTATLWMEKITNDAIRWGITIRGAIDVKGLGATTQHNAEKSTTLAERAAASRTQPPNAGHATWSRDCPTLKEKNCEVNEQFPENACKYFVTDDPNTWEQTRQQNKNDWTTVPVRKGF
ncbi:hypothetical protein PUNSTDRAFT_135134 [Punctularia strigosozonata HHB-11173 SS5]|uniref:uncharacterized protein n=1 Tax=Punctularia strigosozonata (strain HHB-11173) TaxID=741275 RepID=UPI000441640B|nr:uncharacterized protein PUNSTDRAFT_135134 [Punctularia strigosozonata HHB-11173 SS5]EIN07610.1 hypothetical protein PUNSTDRAFT_135134 [Punctularia strigosozonata HHB-11173 SS5]